MVSKRLVKRSAAIARANWLTGLDAAATIAARTQHLLSPGVAPAEKAREARRMAQEKIDAAVEGAIAAHAAWGAVWLQAATGRIRSPHDAATAFLDVAAAAASPGRRTARANARRLIRKPRA